MEALQIDPVDYEDVLEYTRNSIPFHYIYAALKYEKLGCLDQIKLALFGVVSGDRRLYCILHEYLEGGSIKVVINTDSRSSEFVQGATLTVLNKIYPILDEYDSFYCAYIRQDIRKAMISHPKIAKAFPFRPMDEPVICFYINDQHCRQIEKKDIQLPDDYYFIKLREEHAQQLTNEQIKTKQTDDRLVAIRLRCLPAVGVAYKPLGDLAEKSGNLACYEYTDGLGVISMLYCQHEHRGKRLGSLLEEKICQRNLIELGVRPFKGVSINRPKILQMSAKNMLWTTCVDEDANEELFYCSSYSRVDMPRVILYDN